MEEADIIILLLFNRFLCFNRAYRRFRQYKNTTRPDMAKDCKEKFDLEFIKWILWNGRTKRVKNRYRDLISKYNKKVIVIKNQKQLNKYIESIKN